MLVAWNHFPLRVAPAKGAGTRPDVDAICVRPEIERTNDGETSAAARGVKPPTSSMEYPGTSIMGAAATFAARRNQSGMRGAPTVEKNGRMPATGRSHTERVADTPGGVAAVTTAGKRQGTIRHAHPRQSMAPPGATTKGVAARIAKRPSALTQAGG